MVAEPRCMPLLNFGGFAYTGSPTECAQFCVSLAGSDETEKLYEFFKLLQKLSRCQGSNACTACHGSKACTCTPGSITNSFALQGSGCGETGANACGQTGTTYPETADGFGQGAGAREAADVGTGGSPTPAVSQQKRGTRWTIPVPTCNS